MGALTATNVPNMETIIHTLFRDMVLIDVRKKTLDKQDLLHKVGKFVSRI